jgi:hypothetical protein
MQSAVPVFTEGEFKGKPVHGLGTMAFATWFLAERDTNSGNIGLIPDDDGGVRVFKIDHGMSLWFESDPSTTTTEKGHTTVAAKDFLTPENLAKRLEDVGGKYPENSRPFKEFVAEAKRFSAMSEPELNAHIDRILGVYPKQHGADGNILATDLKARILERHQFIKEAVRHYHDAKK